MDNPADVDALERAWDDALREQAANPLSVLGAGHAMLTALRQQQEALKEKQQLLEDMEQGEGAFRGCA